LRANGFLEPFFSVLYQDALVSRARLISVLDTKNQRRLLAQDVYSLAV
jgi:hypothetical protein